MGKPRGRPSWKPGSHRCLALPSAEAARPSAESRPPRDPAAALESRRVAKALALENCSAPSGCAESREVSRAGWRGGGGVGAGSSACWLWHVLGASGALLPRDRGLGSQGVRGLGALRSRLQPSSPCPWSPGRGSPAVRLERESQVKSYAPASKDSFEFQVLF